MQAGPGRSTAAIPQGDRKFALLPFWTVALPALLAKLREADVGRGRGFDHPVNFCELKAGAPCCGYERAKAWLVFQQLSHERFGSLASRKRYNEDYF